MKKAPPRPSRLFNRFLAVFLGGYLKKKFNVKADTGGIENVKPPYIVISNHPGFWDPFILSTFVPYPVQFVASDTYFRNPLIKMLLSLVGAIPKSKFMTDGMTVKTIIQVKNQGGVIGIFPEGTREWDGRTEELLYPTAKLIKSLKIPVVSVLFKGGFLSHPRWAKKARKGELRLKFNVLFKDRDAGSYTVDEVYDIIVNALRHDDYAYQAENKIRFKGLKLAEKLELFLFACPECKSLGRMVSNNDNFHCTECGYAVKYNEYGFFDSLGGKHLHFDSPAKWNEWQMGLLRELLAGMTPDGILLSNKSVILKKGYKYKPLKTFRFGSIELTKNRIIFRSRIREEYTFPLDKITGLNVQYNDLFEFYYEGTLFQFNFNLANDSAYKWVKSINAAQTAVK